MSGFENYRQELADIDREIRQHAVLCGIDLGVPHEVRSCLDESADDPRTTPARQNLRGLLLLRLKVETEMVEQGLSVPPLLPPA